MSVKKGQKVEIIRKISVKDIAIPILALSNSKLSPLQSIVLYLRDDLGLRNRDVAMIMQRDRRTIAQAYSGAKKKCKRR
jgi:DNA-directed RNA polymerase specialized sigma24 family protein